MSMKYPYRELGVPFDRKFRNDLNANFDDIEHDIKMVGGEAAQQALEAAEEANTQAIYAQTSGDYANDKGDYAAQQGDYAKTQGDYAKAQGDAASLAANNANDAANNANNAATNADNAAVTANNAADNANTAAASADDAADNANEAADNANLAAERANNEANYAKAQGDYAKSQAELIDDVLDQGPVVAVNGKTGNVILTAEDINAIPTSDFTQFQQTVTSHLADTDKQINYKSVESFGAVGDYYLPDGTKNPNPTDDTLAIQQAINSDYPIEFGKKSYLVTHLNFSKDKHYLFRDTELVAKENGDSVAIVSSKVHFSGRLIINAAYKTNYGLVFQGGGRSYFENIECSRANMFGLYCSSDRGSNINISTFNQVRTSLNGRKKMIPVEYVSDRVLKINKSLFMDAITSMGSFSKYVFEIDGEINPVLEYTEDSTHLTITFKNNISPTTPNVVLISGGGIFTEGSDAGCFYFGTTDCISNYGVGVRIASLYGHTFANLAVQGAYIGVLLGKYYRNSPVQNGVFIKPYFENITKSDFMTESASANITVIEPIGGSVESLFYPGQTPGGFLLLKRGKLNTPKEKYLGANPGETRDLTDSVVNSVNFYPGGTATQTIILHEDTYNKLLFVTKGEKKPIRFVSANPEYSVNGETEFTLMPNGRPLRLIGISLHNATGGGYKRSWEVVEFGETSRYVPSVERNPNPRLGEQHFDTTLLKPIWWDGTKWVDATGTAV